MTPDAAMAELRELALACGYNNGAGFPEDGDESGIDSLIDYKEALEDRLLDALIGVAA